jgi:hypothetical protein
MSPLPDLATMEQNLRTLIDTKGPWHTETCAMRDGLAIRYRREGAVDKARDLFKETGICDHLAPAEAYLRAQGAQVYSVCTPWSKKCRRWVYFDNVVIDGSSLIDRLNLPACVTAHSHRGTHDGSEQGLVCDEHHDAVLGAHPETAPTARRIS